jgi:hypothetical protein
LNFSLLLNIDERPTSSAACLPPLRQAELREGRYQKPNRMTWEAFREHYSANALPGLAPQP